MRHVVAIAVLFGGNLLVYGGMLLLVLSRLAGAVPPHPASDDDHRVVSLTSAERGHPTSGR